MRDARGYARHFPKVLSRRGAEWAPRAFWQSPRPLEDAMGASTSPTGAIEVYVNHGRWVVECPDCNGAQLACSTDHRFMCNECANFAIGGLWRSVLWPANATAITQELSKRPEVNQNWVPGETLALLKAEAAVARFASAEEALAAAPTLRASDLEDHTHSWPPKSKGKTGTTVTCGLETCGLTVRVEDLEG